MTALKISLSILMILSMEIVFAQGAPPATPIDGGLSLLLTVGGAYGLKKLYNNKRSQ